ncbi:hypothetical protein [Streptomyces sp. AD55]|uniref:hypothetical protein n=1 Tax=Streptomyces sp. AD55 TaxID=3242895 RepID=UPI003529C934
MEHLKKNWPPNELDVRQVRFSSQTGSDLDQLDRFMSSVSAAIVLVDADPMSASCLQLAEVAARNHVPTAVIASMDLDWINMGRLRELESTYNSSFEYETLDTDETDRTVSAYLNRLVVNIDRKKRYTPLRANPA